LINKIKNIANTEDKKRLLSNFFSLSVLQGANYILPLITFPYLVRVLGVEYFGLLAFASATIAYFNILTDYGFNLTATREISIHRANKEKIIEIFSSVMTIKIILMFVSFLLLTILVFSFERFSKDWLIYFLTFGTIIGQVLFPVWFFQGMERMKYITYLNILAKSIFTVAIFIFVQEQSDFYIVPLLTSVGFIVAGVWSLYLVQKEFGVKFKFQNLDVIKTYLIDGWHVFVSRFYVSLYTTTNVILLGLFTNNTAVGYYSIAEKIVVTIGGLFEPANQTIYPYLARKYKENFNQFVELLKKISISFLVISFSFVIISEFFKEKIVYLITGNYSVETTSLLTVFLMRILVFPFGPLLSNSLIIMQKKKEFIKVMNYTVVLDLIIVSPSIYFYGVKGLVYSFIFVLVVHVVLLIGYLQKSISKERNQ
jgi:PST family polysaccharide transporter